MSQSPTDSSAEVPQDEYVSGWQTLSRLLGEGRSFSGRERNCCFLNTGGQRFADVSAVTGLDFIDDARAVALVDWDQDGDLDVWMTNRTAPSIRFLRNDMNAGNHFLALRLVGRTCNRDAIGARVEVILGSPDGLRRVKSVYAGHGFLAQSSKWLHFGLGDAGTVDRIVVHWPGGQDETFTGLEVDEHYEIVQNSRQPVRLDSPGRRNVQLTPSSQKVPESGEAARIVLFSRPDMPELRYRDLDGRHVSTADLPRPLLINLWSSSCLPCVRELKELSSHEDELRSRGLNVLALNIDGLDLQESVDPAEARELLEKFDFPFHAGLADEELVGRLDELQHSILNRIRPLPIPTSFLIDSRQGVVVMYKGRVEVDQLLSDLELIDASGEELRIAATPLSGRWSSSLSPAYVDKALRAQDVINALLANRRNVALAASLVLILIAFVVYRRRKLKRAVN